MRNQNQNDIGEGADFEGREGAGIGSKMYSGPSGRFEDRKSVFGYMLVSEF